MKKHENVETNFYYVTADLSQKYIGCVKPGTSQQKKVNNRINRIHFDEPGLTPLGFLTIYNTNKSRLEALEHDIKADMVDAGFDHYGNDHFKFKFPHKGSRKMIYNLIAIIILTKAAKYCEKYNLEYKITWLQ